MVIVLVLYAVVIAGLGSMLRLFGMNRLERNFEACRKKDGMLADVPRWTRQASGGRANGQANWKGRSVRHPERVRLLPQNLPDVVVDAGLRGDHDPRYPGGPRRDEGRVAHLRAVLGGALLRREGQAGDTGTAPGPAPEIHSEAGVAGGQSEQAAASDMLSASLRPVLVNALLLIVSTGICLLGLELVLRAQPSLLGDGLRQRGAEQVSHRALEGSTTGTPSWG